MPIPGNCLRERNKPFFTLKRGKDREPSPVFSLEFASGAKGNVVAMVSRSTYQGAGSILSQVEYPMIASRIIDGLVDSFEVILIG